MRTVNIEPIMVLLTDTSCPEEVYESLDKVESGYLQYLLDGDGGSKEEANALSIFRELRKAIRSAADRRRNSTSEN